MKRLFVLLSCLILSSCYSFKGVSIPADVKTFYISDVEVDRKRVLNYPIELQVQIAESLREKIQNESRLILVTTEADITFSCTLKKYFIESVAPEEGSTTALNRLEMTIGVEFENLKKPDDNWKKSFSDFEDFPSNQSLIDVEEELIESILEDINDRIFNEAFTNW